MTDFYSVLQRAIASLPDGSGPQRRAVYDKARKALLKQLQSFDPPLPSSDVTAQRLALEDAIRKIENEIARQIRTRRAVQGALPASGAAGKTSARAESAQGAPAQGDQSGEKPAAPRRPAEPSYSREEQAELLESAVSEATIAPEADEPPVPARDLVPAAPAVEEPAPRDDAMMFEREADEEAPPPRRRGRRAEPVFEDDVPEAEYDEVVEADEAPEAEADHDEADEDEPAPARRKRRGKKRNSGADRKARKDARRELRAERRAEKASRRERRRDGGRRKGRSVVSRIALPLVLLALLAGASYAALTQRDALLAVIDGLGDQGTQTREPIAAGSPGDGPAIEKNTDRLPSTVEGEDTRTVTTTPWPPEGGEAADGSTSGLARSDEADPGASRTVGEDVSPFRADEGSTAAESQVAAVDPKDTETDAAPAEESRAESVANVAPSGNQQAVLYEEAARAGEPGTAVPGEVEWSMVEQSIGGGEPEPVVRANATIPERNLNATITIRENNDGGLPASHLIEIAFDVPENFQGGAVKNVPGIIMKQTEQSRGDPLRAAAARVSAGLFWIALSEDAEDREFNLGLLRERDWIDIPILYESDRRAILTLRKGSEGVQSVDAALQAWSPG